MSSYGKYINPFILLIINLNPITMDTATVLEIIKMLDARKAQKSLQHRNSTDNDNRRWMAAKYEAYDELSKHLQSFIEGQVNAVENQTGE
jgi:hypothetical protein